MAQSRQFAVVPDSGKRLRVIDAQTGSFVGSIVLDGEIIGTPIINGNSASIIVKTSHGSIKGATYKLPSGSRTAQFAL